MKREADFKSEVVQSQELKFHLYEQGAHIAQNTASRKFATMYTPKQQ